MAVEKITEAPVSTVAKNDEYILITQTENVEGQNKMALRRMKRDKFISENGIVSFKEDLELTDAEKKKALDNVGGVSADIDQNLPEAKKYKARKNIGVYNTDNIIGGILNKGNYVSVMRGWFEANGSAAITDFTDLVQRWYEVTRTGWFGGVTFSKTSDSSLGTKTGMNAELTCTPSTNATAGTDDYAGLPLFYPIDCNAHLDSDGNPHIDAIEGVCGSFDRYDVTKLTCVLQMAGFLKKSEDADGYSYEYADFQKDDEFYPLQEAISLKDNSIRSFVVHAKYPFNDSWGSASGCKPLGWSVSHNSQLTGIRSAWGNRYCGKTSADDSWIKLMMYIKYGSLTMDNIMAGCLSYYNHPKIAVAETGVERVVIAKTTAFLVGSTVCVGGDYSGTKSVQCSVVDRAKITSIETEEIGGTEYTVLNLDNGGVTFDTTTDNFVTSYAWYSGSTDNVLGNDGSPYSNSSVKEPYKIQGIEMGFGLYETMGDVILRHDTVGEELYQVAHMCRDASKLSTGITGDYETASYGIPVQEASAWKYIKRLGIDDNLHELWMPSELGGGSSIYTRDQYYIETTSAGALREALLFCDLSSGLTGGGVSTVLGDGSLGGSSWCIGGRISLNGNRGELTA